ncbi:unnamed protein product [Prunus armeniaca]
MVVMWEIMPMVFIPPYCKIGGEGEKCDSRGRRNMRGGEERQITSSPATTTPPPPPPPPTPTTT